jgi:hypothetical protein
MPSVRVVNDDGEIVTQEVLSRNCSVLKYMYEEGDERVYDDEFSPSVVQRVEYDHRGQSSSVTSVCGETENRRESDQQPDITVEGIITEPEIPSLKDLKRGDEITLISDVHQGHVYVKRVTIEQSTDIIKYIPDESDQEELAFTFQLQLGQPGDSAQ